VNELDRIARAEGALVVSGAPEGYDALVFCDAARLRGGLSLFIARDEARARAFHRACSFFAPDLETLRLPSWDCQPYDRISPSPRTAARRAGALHRLAVRESGERTLLVVIATVNSVIQRCAPRAVMAEGGVHAASGGTLDIEQLKAYLAVNGYARASTVAERGDYAIRGGVVDVWPADAESPVRLDFFGDAIESVRAFDPETQRTTKQLKAADFTPVSEIALDEDAVSRFRSGFLKRFGGGVSSDPVYETVSAGGRPAGAEHWLPLFHAQVDTVFDYVGTSALVGLDALVEEARDERLEQIRDYYEARKDAQTAPPKGGLAAPVYHPLEPEALYMPAAEWETRLAAFDRRRFTAFQEPGDHVVALTGRQGRTFAAERQADQNVFEAARDHAVALRKAGKRVLLAAWSEGASERLGMVLGEHGLAPIEAAQDWPQAAAKPANTIARAVLELERGFETDDLAVLSEQDLLGDRLARPRKRKNAADVISEAGSLSPGDLVIHADHGLGRYLGLKTLTVGEAPHDCLELEYSGGTRIRRPGEALPAG